MNRNSPSGKGKVPAAATLGLFAAWAVHDLEELVTMPGWADRARPRLRRRLPWVPERVWSGLAVSPEHARAAIGSMGVLIAGAAIAGARTNGRSAFYQCTLLAFGGHSVSHLALSAATRGYTPGVVTAPVLVAPFSLWAWGRLRAAGVAGSPGGPSWGALGMLPLALAGAHGGAAVLTRSRARRRALSSRPGR